GVVRLTGSRHVWSVPAAPQADLVAEDAQATGPASADGPFGDDAALIATQVGHRGLLDHERRLPQLDLARGSLLDDERVLGQLDLERGVVQVARWATAQP